MKKITISLLLCMVMQFSFSQVVTLNLKAYMEGPYYNGQMTPFLNVLGYLPTVQPYNTAPWNYPGTESITEFPSSNIVDWVLVDVLKPHTVGNQVKFEVVGRKAGFLFKTGLIKDIDGISNLTVQSNINSGFYVRIHHRNHLSIISSVPLVESAGVFSYDFTLSAEQAMGGTLSQKQLSSVIWGMIAADANASGQIDNRDKNDVWLPQQNLTGYYKGDFNMDTQVDNDDKIVKWEPNSGKSTFQVLDSVSTPTSLVCGDTMIDSRDGQTYNTVLIGEQCWMAENLNFGTMIQGTTTMTDNSIIEKYCYDNMATNCDTFGGLYQWNELMEYSTIEGSQGICPDNWHVATDMEWFQLANYLDPTYSNPDYQGWQGTDIGIQLLQGGTSGFQALLSGTRMWNTGGFLALNQGGFIWTSTINPYNTIHSWFRYLAIGNPQLYKNGIIKTEGRSVRCLKNTDPPTWSCGDALLDTRDNQTYNTVQVGEQCWMAENLNIGTMIPGANEMTNNSIIEKYCYDNNTANCDTYSGLYQWNEMMEYSCTPGVQGICPSGWHLPTDGEWCTVTQFIDPTVNCNVNGWSGTDIGNKIKSTTGWNSGGNGTNTSGFTALPGGLCFNDGSFSYLVFSAYFWSSTAVNIDVAWRRSLSYGNANIYRNYYYNTTGYSVRCLKDTQPTTWSCGDPLNDTRDGQSYNTVQIGEQCWMAENLNIGTVLSTPAPQTDNGIIEKYCYNNNPSNCDTYGGFYQWNETMQYVTNPGTIGICPVGWHVPSDSEWYSMENYIDPAIDNPAEKGWRGIDGGTKLLSGGSTGFDGLFAGFFSGSDNNFYFLGTRAYFRTSSLETPSFTFYRLLDESYTNVYRNGSIFSHGYSVRCLKNQSFIQNPELMK